MSLGRNADALRRWLGEDVFERMYSAMSWADEDKLFGLSLLERIALHVYTDSRNWYLQINQALRSGQISDDLQRIIALIDSALEKLPIYPRLVYRGVDLDLDEARLRYSPDGPWQQWQAFSSTSPHLRSAYSGNVLFVVHSHQGRLLQGYTAGEHEDEVLLPRNLWYRVYDVGESSGRLVIQLGEVQW